MADSRIHPPASVVFKQMIIEARHRHSKISYSHSVGEVQGRHQHRRHGEPEGNANGLFVMAENGALPLTVNRPSAGAGEKFAIAPA